jgi:hypothetical protein
VPAADRFDFRPGYSVVTAIARGDGRTYERNFKVITGVDGEVEVLSR